MSSGLGSPEDHITDLESQRTRLLGWAARYPVIPQHGYLASRQWAVGASLSRYSLSLGISIVARSLAHFRNEPCIPEISADFGPGSPSCQMRPSDLRSYRGQIPRKDSPTHPGTCLNMRAAAGHPCPSLFCAILAPTPSWRSKVDPPFHVHVGGHPAPAPVGLTA